MWKPGLSQPESRIALLLGLLLILIACALYMDFTYSSDILPDKQAQKTYLKTPCFLMSKKLSTKGYFIHTYRANFLVSYVVNGVKYKRWVSGNGLDMTFNRDEVDQEDTLSQYDVGETYTCYYDSANPQNAFLVERHNWLSIIPLIVPALIFIIAFYYFIRNIYKIVLSPWKKHKTKTRKHRT